MFKNVAAKFIVFAFDSTTNLPKTGDGANITAYVSKDYGTVTVLADTTATEMDATNAKGYYLFDAAQGETNGDCLLVSAKSATANIVVVGAPATIFTDPPSFTAFVTPTNLTAAQIATGVWQDATAGDFTTASSIGKSLYTGNVAPGGTNGMFIAGTNAATTVTTALTTTFTGNLTGSVASVTGAVGSVTGAVGSVTGAVGSVTGAVGSVTGLTASDVGAIKTKTDQLAFTVANQVDSNVIDWKGAAAPAMTGDSFARLGAPVGASVSADVAAVKASVGSPMQAGATVAVTSNIKKNQALAKFEFLVTDSTTHAPKTGVVVTVTRSIDGGAFAAGTLSAVTEISSGIYSVDFGAGDLNGNVITLRGTGAAADDVLERIVTQP